MSQKTGGDDNNTTSWYYVPSDALNVNGVSFNDYFLSTMVMTALAVLVMYILLLLFRQQEFKDLCMMSNVPFIVCAMTVYQLMFFFSWKRPSLASSSSIYTTTGTILISSAMVYSVFFFLLRYIINEKDEVYSCVLLYFVTLLTSLSMIPIYVSSLPDMNIVPSLLRRNREDRMRFFVSLYTQYAMPAFLVMFSVAVLIAIWMSRLSADADMMSLEDKWTSAIAAPAVILFLLGYYFYDRISIFTPR